MKINEKRKIFSLLLKILFISFFLLTFKNTDIYFKKLINKRFPFT